MVLVVLVSTSYPRPRIFFKLGLMKGSGQPIPEDRTGAPPFEPERDDVICLDIPIRTLRSLGRLTVSLFIRQGLPTKFQRRHSSKERRHCHAFLIAVGPTDFRTQVLRPKTNFQSAKPLSSSRQTPHDGNDGYRRRLLPSFSFLFHGIVVLEIILLSLSPPPLSLSLSLSLSRKSIIENDGQEAVGTAYVGAYEHGIVADWVCVPSYAFIHILIDLNS